MSQSLSERFAAIRRAYAAIEAMPYHTWDRGDPYFMHWRFTPIEALIWADLRSYFCVTAWPQYPVGKYFVDFAFVTAKVVIECDGKKYHDAARDAERDAHMRSLGWRVFRIAGVHCFKEEAALNALREVGDVLNGFYGRRVANIPCEKGDLYEDEHGDVYGYR